MRKQSYRPSHIFAGINLLFSFFLAQSCLVQFVSIWHPVKSREVLLQARVSAGQGEKSTVRHPYQAPKQGAEFAVHSDILASPRPSFDTSHFNLKRSDPRHTKHDHLLSRHCDFSSDYSSMHAYRGRGGPSRSTPANVQCQKCLKRDMYQQSIIDETMKTNMLSTALFL